jgi:RNA polymerase sigma-70 factor, ECF subfamily
MYNDRAEGQMPDWQKILKEEGPTVWRTAYRLLGNRTDADDCLQETLLAALEISRREDVRQWRSLLQHLATARALDCLRRRRRRPSGQIDQWEAVAGCAPEPSQVAEDAELADWLRSALAGIAATQAEVFWLHCMEEWSYEEIARRMKVSTAAVGVHLYRARKRLGALLAARIQAAKPLRQRMPCLPQEKP